MGKSTINTCLCDLFSVGVSKSPSVVNLMINYPCHLAVLSRRLPDNVNCHRMGKSTINTCLCDLFSVGVSKSPSVVNLLINYPCHLAVLSRDCPTTLIEIAVYRVEGSSVDDRERSYSSSTLHALFFLKIHLIKLL